MIEDGERDGSGITAKNYASHVDTALERCVRLYRKANDARGAMNTAAILLALRRAMHFAVPDGGKILGAGWDTLSSLESIRLPYEAITVESYDRLPDGSVKSVLIAQDVEAAEDAFPALIPVSEAEDQVPPSGPGIVIGGMFNHGERGWALHPFAAFRPRSPSAIGGLNYLHFYWIAEYIILPRGYRHHAAMNRQDMAGLFRQHLPEMMELLEALGCVNVESEPFLNHCPAGVRRVNRRRLYETHRLVIKKPDTESRLRGVGTRSSPRAHLRRGHIRRLPSGNIWINACAVGSLKNGFVHKDYAVTAGAGAIE